MRIVAIVLDNGVKGIDYRDTHIESLIRQFPELDLVVLPELFRCSYTASQEI